MHEQDDQSYEVFRRAILHRDEAAWSTIYSRYRALLIAWANQCSGQAYTYENAADIADQALARAWAALTPERFANFPTLARLLGYLRACVTSTVIDILRTRAAAERTQQHYPDAEITLEQTVLSDLDRAALWQTALALAATPAERIVLIESFAYSLPPRTIQSRHAQLFGDISAIYDAKRRLLARLRRNEAMRCLNNAFMSA